MECVPVDTVAESLKSSFAIQRITFMTLMLEF